MERYVLILYDDTPYHQGWEFYSSNKLNDLFDLYRKSDWMNERQRSIVIANLTTGKKKELFENFGWSMCAEVQHNFEFKHTCGEEEEEEEGCTECMCLDLKNECSICSRDEETSIYLCDIDLRKYQELTDIKIRSGCEKCVALYAEENLQCRHCGEQTHPVSEGKLPTFPVF